MRDSLRDVVVLLLSLQNNPTKGSKSDFLKASEKGIPHVRYVGVHSDKPEFGRLGVGRLCFLHPRGMLWDQVVIGIAIAAFGHRTLNWS